MGKKACRVPSAACRALPHLSDSMSTSYPEAWECAAHGTRHSARERQRRGFTLVEVLVVMIILAILAAVVVPRVVGRTEDARRARAVSDVESLGTALDLLKADTGEYPTTEQGLQALREAPSGVKNWNGPYLKKPLGGDPWGNDYVYTAPGEHNPDSYDLMSNGADGQPGGVDKDADVTNWEEK